MAVVVMLHVFRMTVDARGMVLKIVMRWAEQTWPGHHWTGNERLVVLLALIWIIAILFAAAFVPMMIGVLPRRDGSPESRPSAHSRWLMQGAAWAYLGYVLFVAGGHWPYLRDCWNDVPPPMAAGVSPMTTAFASIGSPLNAAMLAVVCLRLRRLAELAGAKRMAVLATAMLAFPAFVLARWLIGMAVDLYALPRWATLMELCIHVALRLGLIALALAASVIITRELRQR